MKMKRRKSNVFSILFYYFKRDKNANEQCMEKVLSLIKCMKSGLRSFMLEISHWTMLHGRVDHLKLIAIKLRTINTIPHKR